MRQTDAVQLFCARHSEIRPRGVGEGERAPEGRGLDDDLDVSGELTCAGEGLVYLYGVVQVAVCAEGRGHLVGLAVEVPGRRAGRPEDTRGCSMGLCRGTEGSRWIMSTGAPRVTSNEDMWRIHGNLCFPNQSPLRVLKLRAQVHSIVLRLPNVHGAIV